MLSDGLFCSAVSPLPTNETEDVFAWCLRCESIADSRQHKVLWWHSPVPPIRIETESALEPVLVPFKKKERGMFREQPEHRAQKLQRVCHKHHVTMKTALSLRRHYMKRYNPGLRMSQLRLGKEEDINQSARLFEEAVQTFLERQRVEFYAEQHQKEFIRQHKRPDQPYPPTPDFILRKPLRIKTYTIRRESKNNRDRRVIKERSVNCTCRPTLTPRCLCIGLCSRGLSSLAAPTPLAFLVRLLRRPPHTRHSPHTHVVLLLFLLYRD